MVDCTIDEILMRIQKVEATKGETHRQTCPRGYTISKPLKSLVREIGLFIGMKSTKLAADEKTASSR